MAPAIARTRSRKVAKTVTRKPRQPAKESTQSWDLVEDDRDSDIENEDPLDDERPLAIQQAAQTLEQLHRMTAGLEREVESFAVDLDRFLDDLRTEDTYDAVHDLVLSFKNAASREVIELEKEYGRERREQLAREWLTQANLSSGEKKSTRDRAALHPRPQSYASPGLQELRAHQAEADTWELFRITLEQHYNTNIGQLQEEIQADLEKLGPVHRYTPENDVYQRFTITDSLGRERALIKAWLEQSSQYSHTTVSDMMQELEKGQQVAWTRGWMHTREKIKGEKRVRVWPAPDTSPLPQLRSQETNELLATCLDPDAPSRQRRSLEKADAFQERAMWIASWELLRRGKPWSEICDWAETQKEGWRSALLARGMLTSDAPSLAVWRHACFQASQSKCSSDYEAAVYGLLGGNVTAVQKVCHTVDDSLFAHYSTALVQQFDQYQSHYYPERMPKSLRNALEQTSGWNQAETAQTAITELIKQLRTRQDTKAESIDPIKIVQAYLMANEAESLIHTVGTVTSESQSRQDLPESGVAKSLTTLRMVAHIAIVLQLLRTEILSDEETDAEDNVIAAYISELNNAGKRELIPTYAARLAPERCSSAMASVLEGVTELRERSTILSLMQQKDIDISRVLWELLSNALGEALSQSPGGKPKSILRFTDTEPELYPGQQISLDEEPDLATPLDEALVRQLEWFLLLPQHWELTFRALSTALRKLLIHGRFACARLIVENFKTDRICQDKTYKILGRSVDLFSGDISRPTDREEALQWDTMQRQAQTYHSLEKLVDVYELLFSWRKQEQLYAHSNPRSPSVPKELKTTFTELEEAMEPLLSADGFLLETADEEEEKDIKLVRQAYVTDAVVAYNTVLFGAGRLISRDMLLQSMDLSTVVAKESTRLTETFMQADRLKELVTSFAITSKSILVMKATGKPWKPRYERRSGKDVSIWDVTLPKTV